jgi:hypothetical protein
MKKLILFILITGVFAIAQAPQPKAKEAGWIPLFDGRTLNGWHPEGNAQWRTEGGALVSDQGGDGWLRSDKTYGNFLLRVDFRNSPKGNSGVFLRATRETNAKEHCNPAGGYELQINNEDPKWATGSIEDVIQRIAPVNPAPNEWHTYNVEVRGDHIVASLDGKKVLDGHDTKIASGCLGLQHHKGMKIEFRRISIKPLP